MRKRNSYWPTTLKLGTGNATWICATLAARSRGVGIQPHAPECEFVLSVASGESGRYVLQVALQCSRAVHLISKLQIWHKITRFYKKPVQQPNTS